MHLPTSFFTDYSLTIDETVALVASTAPAEADCGCDYAAETEELPEVKKSARWAGVLGVEGELTGDGRFITPGALRWESLPIPIRYVSADVGAHSGAVVVGRIDTVERLSIEEANERLTEMGQECLPDNDKAQVLWGAGDYDLGSDVGKEAARVNGERLMNGVSMDLDDVAFEVRVAADAPALMGMTPQELQETVANAEKDEDGRVKVQEMAPDDEVMVTTDARVRAATQVAVPAFSRAMIYMVDEPAEALVASITLRMGGTRFEVEYPQAPVDYNWVEDVGGLPEYIDTIADAVKRKNPEMSQGHTIAIAVNACKKMCATGDINFPGDQDVNPGSRAKACAAVAEWEEKKARAKADNGETTSMSTRARRAWSRQTLATQTFDSDDQWRNPDNGRWIDMPGEAIKNLMDMVEDAFKDNPDDTESVTLDDAKGPMPDLKEGIEADLANGDEDAAKAKVKEVLDGFPFEDYDDPRSEKAKNALEEFNENYIAAEQTDLDKDEDSDLTKEEKKSGRGPNGKVRNFKAMGDKKFEQEAAKVEEEDNDPEAMEAVAKERERRAEGGSDNDAEADSDDVEVPVDAPPVPAATKDLLDPSNGEGREDTSIDEGGEATPLEGAMEQLDSAERAFAESLAPDGYEWNYYEEDGDIPAGWVLENVESDSWAMKIEDGGEVLVDDWAQDAIDTGNYGPGEQTPSSADGPVDGDGDGEVNETPLSGGSFPELDHLTPEAEQAWFDPDAPQGLNYHPNLVIAVEAALEGGMADAGWQRDVEYGALTLWDGDVREENGMISFPPDAPRITYLTGDEGMGEQGWYTITDLDLHGPGGGATPYTTPEEAGEAAKEQTGYSLLAAAAPVDPDMPPAAHFDNPGFKMPTPLTVTKEGRVMGHLAIWGTCHLTHTNQGKCIVPPKSRSGYAYFATGSVLTAEGAEIPVGQITLGTGHAGEALNAKQTLAHYDNTGKAVADITVGEDAHGIWFSGSLRPGVTPKQVRTLRAHPLSGDWRRMAGSLEMVAALCVNVQGFPVPRPKGRVSSGNMQTLVAAGMLPPRKVVRPFRKDGTRDPDALSNDDLRYLKRLAARERVQEEESRIATLASADRLAQTLRNTAREDLMRRAQRLKVEQMAARLKAF